MLIGEAVNFLTLLTTDATFRLLQNVTVARVMLVSWIKQFMAAPINIH